MSTFSPTSQSVDPSPSSTSTILNANSLSRFSTSTSDSITLPSSLNGTHYTGVSSRLSNGVVVGIGIGSSFAGAFLAFLVAWIFFTRLRRETKRRSHKGRKPSLPTKQLNDIPMERADDSTIRRWMEDLNELINQHVENHYHVEESHDHADDLRRNLGKFGFTDLTEPTAQRLAILLISPRTRYAAIRNLIAWTIFRHINVESGPEVSLLPKYIVDFATAILGTKRRPGEGGDYSNHFVRWRHLSGFLLPSVSPLSGTIQSNPDVYTGVISNVELLNSILLPFIKPGIESRRAQEVNLTSIITEAAYLGISLFSQPAIWVFGWDGKNLKSRTKNIHRDKGATMRLVVFPSIGEKITREGREQLRVIVDVVEEKL